MKKSLSILFIFTILEIIHSSEGLKIIFFTFKKYGSTNLFLMIYL